MKTARIIPRADKDTFASNLWVDRLQVASKANNGVQKLRELILELAVRGKLVPQNQKDEPASELLKRVGATKGNLVKSGKVKKEKPLPEISFDEIFFEIPKGWEWVRLSNLAFCQPGYAFKSSGFNQQQVGLPLIRIRDVGVSKPNTYFEGDFRDEFLVHRGDYLISMDGEFRVAIWEGSKSLLNQRVSRLIFFGDEIQRSLIAQSLQQRLNLLQGVKSYTTVDHLSGKQISEAVIALPPLAEQKRIVAKVDELMALCDRLEAQEADAAAAHETLVKALLGTLTQSQTAKEFQENWRRIAKNFDTLFTTESSIDTLKQTILQLAVMGKLVPQNPKDEPASELLKRIKTEMAKLIKLGKIKEAKPLPDISDIEKPFDIPNGWEWIRFGNVVLRSEAGWSPSCEQRPKTGKEWGVLKVSAISWGSFCPEENKALPANLSPKKEYEVVKGDFLISRANTAELVARSVIVRETPSALMLSDKIIRLILSSLVDSDYCNLVNLSNFSREYYSRVAGGTSSSMKNVSREQILSLAVPLPPLAEQSRIVAKVDELMALCDNLKDRLAKAHTLHEHLATALVEKAVLQ